MIRFIHIKKNGGTSVYKFLAKNKIECLLGPDTNMNNQVDYILNAKGECLVDKIFKFENLENEIKEHFNIDAKFPHLTKSTYDNYEDYYTKDLKEVVYLRLKKDFEYFNYEE